MVRRLRRAWKRVHGPDLSRDFREHHLFTFAAAIAFRALYAATPLAMFVLGVFGMLHLQEAWTSHIAPDVHRAVSPDVYRVIDSAIRLVLRGKQLFWATAGGLIALWIMSGGIRAAMDALDEIYESRRERPTRERFVRSLWLGAAVGGCLVVAGMIVRLGPLALGRDPGVLLEVVSFVVRWTLAAGLLGLAIFLIVRYAPTRRQPVRWVSLGSALAVGAWVLMSLAFGAYAGGFGSYGSVYGSLASVVVLFTYVYLSAIAFLLGAQVDAFLREETSGG